MAVLMVVLGLARFIVSTVVTEVAAVVIEKGGTPATLRRRLQSCA